MRETYLSIQYLRALAALLVVMHHARNPHPWLFNPFAHFDGFARGVDVFFVISGFIMAAIGSKEAPLDFARKRIMRVAPIYWLASVAAAFLLVRKSGIGPEVIEHLVSSFLFVPHVNPSGEAFPVLPPGWTLNYEMYFYGLFFLSLWTRHPIRNCLALLLACVATGLVFKPQGIVAATYTNQLLTEFAAGLLIGAFRHKISSRHQLSSLMLPGSILLLTSTHWLASALGATLIVTSSVAWEARLTTSKLGKALGDASYFTYLSHHFVLAVLLKTWERLPLVGWPQFITFVGSAILLSCIVGILGHRAIEKPITQNLNRMFARKRTSPGIAAKT